MKKVRKAEIGIVVDGAQDNYDLAYDHLAILEEFGHDNTNLIHQIARAVEASESEDAFWESLEGEILLDDIVEEVNCYALPYSYYAWRAGDYGFWPDWDLIKDDIDCGELVDIDEMNTIKANNYCAVNDHGNFSLYDCLGNVLWDCV